jgi:hypothetical protein
VRAIFIRYRREDAEGQAGRLFKDLVGHFGEQAVFMDVAGIEPGRDFRKAIDEHVGSCGVLLAIIGKDWLEAVNADGARRLDDPGDFVRLETSSALKRDIPVVPVLVHGAQMPRPEQLPDDIKDLAYRNAIELTHARWDSDLTVLIKALGRYVTPADATRQAAPQSAAPARSAPAPGPGKPMPKWMYAGLAAALVAAVAIYFMIEPGEEAPGEAALAAAEAAPDEAAEPVTATIAAGGPHTPIGVADWDGDGHQDILAREDASSEVLVFPGQGGRAPLQVAGSRVGFTLQNFTAFGAVDWDRDGHADIIARDDGSAALQLYPGRGERGAKNIYPKTIGIGWAGYTSFGAGRWDDDGDQDIVTRHDESGDLFVYPGESKREMSNIDRAQIGNGWQGHTSFGIADWDGDGHRDIITRNDASGELYLYPGESKREMSTTDRVKIGDGWTGYTFFGIADWDGDGNQDLIARNDTTRALVLCPGNGKRGAMPDEEIPLGNGF